MGSQAQLIPSGEILAETLRALSSSFFSHRRSGQFLGNLVIALRAEGTARVMCMRWEYTCCIRVAERRLGRLWGAVRAGRGSPQPERGGPSRSCKTLQAHEELLMLVPGI